MLYAVLKGFPYSRDGVTMEHAVAGAECDIPDALVAGLSTEGYIGKAIRRAPANKMMPEMANK